MPRPLLLLFVIALASCGPAPCALPTTTLQVGPTTTRVEIARRPGERVLGLSGRASLAKGWGMLFVYDEPCRPRFTMRDMHFDLDLVWIRGGRIVGLTRGASAQVAERGRSYAAPAPVDRVLEVAAGTVDEHGWREGLRVRRIGDAPFQDQ